MSETKLLKLTNDYIFKRTFGYEGSGEVTKIFLRDILQSDISEIKLDNQTITEKELMDDKVGIMDIKAVLNGNLECDIEMQIVNQHNIEKRILFYWAKMYTRSLKEGNDYNSLKKSICVLIADFELDSLHEIKKFMSKWKIREEEYTAVVLTDVFEVVIIELPKYIKYAKKEKKDGLNLWLKFLENPEVRIMPNESDKKEIKETKNAIKKAQDKLEKISQDEHERYLAELREKYIMDQKAIQEYGYLKGIKEEKIKIAKELLKNKVDINLIAKTTELTEEEVEALL